MVKNPKSSGRKVKKENKALDSKYANKRMIQVQLQRHDVPGLIKIARRHGIKLTGNETKNELKVLISEYRVNN